MSINIIGPITILNPKSDPDMPELMFLESKDKDGVKFVGWHVNSTEWIAEISEYEVFPSTPYNVFAGVQTYFYSFPDEATAQSFGIGLPDPVDELV